MEEVRRIYLLLLHSSGLKIRDIANNLNLDKYYVAGILFSTENIPYWYQDNSSLWFAKEGAIQIDELEEDKLTIPTVARKSLNLERFLQGNPSISLRSILSHLGQYRIYSDNEIVELIIRYRNGDQKSYDLIVKSYQRLIVGLAYLYCKDGVPLEELIQEGNIGLIKAIERFDESRFHSFSNYAKSWISEFSIFL